MYLTCWIFVSRGGKSSKTQVHGVTIPQYLAKICENCTYIMVRNQPMVEVICMTMRMRLIHSSHLFYAALYLIQKEMQMHSYSAIMLQPHRSLQGSSSSAKWYNSRLFYCVCNSYHRAYTIQSLKVYIYQSWVCVTKFTCGGVSELCEIDVLKYNYLTLPSIFFNFSFKETKPSLELKEIDAYNGKQERTWNEKCSGNSL